jgi:hypothetical protein
MLSFRRAKRGEIFTQNGKISRFAGNDKTGAAKTVNVETLIEQPPPGLPQKLIGFLGEVKEGVIIDIEWLLKIASLRSQ